MAKGVEGDQVACINAMPNVFELNGRIILVLLPNPFRIAYMCFVVEKKRILI